MKKKMFIAATVAAIIGLGSIAKLAYSAHGDIVEYYRAELSETLAAKDAADREYDAKIEGLKDEIIAQLKQCESGAKTEEDAPIILDSNSQMSLGLMMFQIKTVQHYVKRFEGRDITRKEAVMIALDEEASKELAKKIIFTVGPEKDWVNCSRKHDLVAQVALVKKL